MKNDTLDEYLIWTGDDYSDKAYHHTNNKRKTRTVKYDDVKLVCTGNGYEISWEDKTIFMNYADAANLENSFHIMRLESDNPAERRKDKFFKLRSKA